MQQPNIYSLYYQISWLFLLSCDSCFSHAVALAEGAFLTKLSPSIKKTTLAGMDKGVPMIPPIDPSAEDKDMEDGIEALTQETDTAYASEQVKLV